jgi:23S rRNA pseudouridine2605 synthase
VGGSSVSERALRALRAGIELEDGLTAPADARRLGAHEIEITIREGRKHQVRRMCAAVGHPVLELQRVAFGPLRLDALKPSQHRLLSVVEVERLRAL